MTLPAQRPGVLPGGRSAVRPAALVDRDAELAVLSAMVDSARAGDGGVVFVVGEPGIGKSRLVDEAVGIARRTGVRVLRGRATRTTTSGMRPFVESLVSLAREGWSPPDSLGPYLGVLGQLVPDWRRGGPGETAAASPVLRGEAILRVLKASATEASVLVLEDLHEADPDTVAALEYLIDHLAGQSLAVICAVRDVPCPVLDLADHAYRRDPDALITLTRLGFAATAELGAALLGSERALLPVELCDAMFRDSAGNPLILTEMLRETVPGRAPVDRGGDGASADAPWLPVPQRLAWDVAERLRRVDPVTRTVVQTASVIGEEFPGELVGAAARIDASDLAGALDAAAREYFLAPASRGGWFAFHHPMIEQAVQAQLGPRARQAIAARAATVVETQYPGLPGEWCVRAALLRETAGDGAAAAGLFVAAGRRAAEDGSPALATEFLCRAWGLLPADHRDPQRAEVLGLLVTALGAEGRYREAFEHVGDVEAVAQAGLPATTTADLHIRLARVALRACWPERALPHIDAARHAIGGSHAAAQRAELDAIEAYAVLETPARDHAATAEALARRAIDRAREADLPAVECDALLTLGYRNGNHRPQDALACYRRAYRIARTHALTSYGLEALQLTGAHRWMWHADPDGLHTAVAAASAAGAVVETRQLQLSLAVDALLRARFADAETLLDTAWADIARFRLPGLGSYALAVRALLHAHSGRQQALDAAVADFDQWRGGRQDEVPLVQGLARGFGALLQGDLEGGRDHLRGLRDSGEGMATKYYLCGQYGLSLLVDVVLGTAGRADHVAVRGRVASGLVWNSQFVHLAEAVLSGRERDAVKAQDAVTLALSVSAPFPVARHLGLRLVAPSAARDGWGEPVRWLQDAESFFAANDLAVAAKSCRDLLRELGEPVRQRRSGSGDVPRRLWAMGVTVRESEVLELVARHLTNREIAAELHLSHRTVERHVASLLTKTGTDNRRGLAALSAPR